MPATDPTPDAAHAEPPADPVKRSPRTDFEARAHAAAHDIEAGVREARAQFDATNERIRARTGRNLFAAIGIGLVMGAFFLVSLIILEWLFMIFAAVLIGFTVFELAGALRFAGRDVPRVASTVVAVATIPAAFFFHVEGLWLAVIAAIAPEPARSSPTSGRARSCRST
jgi:phosphatidate cytidylyltransferase